MRRLEVNMKKIASFFVKIMNKYLPDPFLFAIILTFVVFVAGIGLTAQTPLAMLTHWGNGFWKLLGFSMQMVLVLVTGNAMATAPPFKKGLSKLAKVAKTPFQAIVLVTFISIIASWVNWGFGLIIGALFARELAKQVKGLDYRLVIASAYSGFIVWHGGLSASIPLQLAAAKTEALQAMTGGAVSEIIPTSETIFSPFNLIISVAILVILPFINAASHPSPEEAFIVDPALLEDHAAEKKFEIKTPADRLENSKIVWFLTVAMGFAYLVYYFSTKGFNLGLDIVNFAFMYIGILLHGNLKSYIEAVFEATKGAAGIILQFPFYAGIMGMMTGASQVGVTADGAAIMGASLAGVISNAFVAIATPKTFPLFTFLSAGIVNFFVPSGGGQWAVQGPIMMPAGASLGVPAAKTAMSIAWGDAWTNMIQPFWALPALGVAKLSAKDIMGYCVISLIVGGLIVMGVFLAF